MMKEEFKFLAFLGAGLVVVPFIARMLVSILETLKPDPLAIFQIIGAMILGVVGIAAAVSWFARMLERHKGPTP